MTRDPKYDVLFEPIALGPKTARNRFFQTPHCGAKGTEQPGLQAHLRGMKAEGGWGVVFTEACSVSPECDSDPQTSATLWDDEDAHNLRLMVDLAHRHGALAGVELLYTSLAPNANTRIPARGPSQGPNPLVPMSPLQAMSVDDVHEVQQLHVAAALRARDAGFDLIEIEAVGGMGLINEFLFPLFNHRDDEYGGSFENRARFAVELVQALRDAVGDDCALGIRFGVDTLDPPNGLGDLGIRAKDEGHRFIAHLDHLVDYWDVQVAGFEEADGITPSRTHPENAYGQYTTGVKAHTSKPVVNNGRFTNPDTMVAVINNGQCDMIGAARPSIADPFLPRKVAEGRLDEIRECIGCNMCYSRWMQGGLRVVCTQNATVGEEYRRGWHPERFERAANAQNDVLIVGAGPAGMECAIVLAKRGMRRVHLVEAEREPGGSVGWISRMPGFGEWGRVVDHRKIQIDKLKNLDLITGTRLTAEEVLDYGAEIVVVATGSRWSTDGISGVTLTGIEGADARLPHVATPEQLMVEGKQLGRRVVVFDAEGYFTGGGIALHLARTGHEVTLVTPADAVGPFLQLTLEQSPINRELHAAGVQIVARSIPITVSAESVAVLDHLTGEQRELACDGVALVTWRRSRSDLYDELRERADDVRRAGIEHLYRIGDCVAPNTIAQAVFSGHRLAREIDSENPSIPLPVRREERRLVSEAQHDYVEA